MARCVLLIACVASLGAATRDEVGSESAWRSHRDAMLKDPSLLRLYSLEEARDPASPIPDLAGKGKPLAAAPPGKEAAAEAVRLAEGRWPGKTALRLDALPLATEAFEVTGRAFTVAAWVRTHGPGTHCGNSGATNGTIFAVGCGYWDGWRLTLSYPSGRLGFEIGRPKPSHSVAIHTGPLADGVWHHLAATWDGQEMRAYVDGLLAASGKYAGAYTHPPQDKQLRVGFAGSGVGSVVMDVAEVAAFGRARTAEEILRDAHSYAPLSQAYAAQFQTAERLFATGNYAAAADEFGALIRTRSLHPDYRAAAGLRRAQALRAGRDLRGAAEEFAAVLQNPGASARHARAALGALLDLLRQGALAGLPNSVYERMLLMDDVPAKDKLRTRLLVARELRNKGDHAAACEHYRELLKTADLTPRERLDLQLELGHTLWEAGDLASARRAYLAVVTSEDATPPYQSAAILRVAATFARAGNYKVARAEYAKLATLVGAPAHHQGEARERLRELDRIEAGMPPRDPASSRVQLPKRPEPAVTLHVAPDGSDTNDGTPRRPFATIRRARDAIRAIKKKGELPKGGVAVLIEGAEYRLAEGIKLSSEDSGTEAAPIVYRAAGKEKPRFTGGVRIPRFEPVKDPAVLARLDEAVRGKVVQADLRSLGITDLGEAFTPGKRLELFFNGAPMPLARWPNEGYVRTGDIRGEQPIRPHGIQGSRDGKFTYDGDRPSRWKSERDPWLYGFWFWDWADGYQKVAAIDPEQRVITTASPYHGYGFRKGQRYFALNLLCELDRPGEWYLDRSTGVLYFYPPARLSRATVEVSVLGEPMVTMEGVSHVTLQGLVFETSRDSGVVIRGGERCLLAGCVLRCLGESGVIIEGGSNHGILGCDIHTVGRNGTWLKGGDRKTLTPSGHFVENCHIYDFSRVYRTYTPAVLLEGVGGRVAHNLFHHAPHSAMRVEGNDHIVEFNEVHSVVHDSDDQGAVDMWFNPAYRGNVFRFNYWHHIGSGLGHGNAAIRLDDAICGTLIYGNIFYRASDAAFGGVQIHGGKENVVDGNVFLDCKYAVSFSPWGEKRWREIIAGEAVVKKTTQEVVIAQPPYSTRYPELARLAENHDANFIWRNLVAACGAFTARDPGVNDFVDNYVTGHDPGLVDPETGRLRPKALRRAAEGLGPLPVGIPFEEIGLYPDEFRATWPVRHKVIESYKPATF